MSSDLCAGLCNKNPLIYSSSIQSALYIKPSYSVSKLLYFFLPFYPSSIWILICPFDFLIPFSACSCCNPRMKFGKRYTEYVEREARLWLNDCSYVEFKRYKKLFKKCGSKKIFEAIDSGGKHALLNASDCPSPCSVCDGKFFPKLMQEVSAVLGCFNAHAQRLLDVHLASGFQKLYLRFRNKYSRNHNALIEEGRILVNYASMNSIAIRKILKKYDKIHCSGAGREFKARLQAMHVELLQSPWLVELSALHINLRHSDSNTTPSLPEGFTDCYWKLEDDKPTICCTMQDSMSFEIDLACAICLETVFDPIALGCGHIFCNSCACSAAYVPTIHGTKSASANSKCPLCRQAGVYLDAVHLTEVSLLIRRKCKDYWEERSKRERFERVHQAKEHWDKQLQAVMGL